MDYIRRILFSLMLLMLLALLAFVLFAPGPSALAQEPTERPAMPQNLRVTVENGVATARWDPVDDVTLYYLVLTADVGPGGSRVVRELWAPEPSRPRTSIELPAEFLYAGVEVRMLLVGYAPPFPSHHGPPNRMVFTVPNDFPRLPPCGDGEKDNARGSTQGIPIGAIGWIFRHEGVLQVYEVISPTEGVPVLTVTPDELDATLLNARDVTCVTVSDNRRVGIFVWPNRDVVVSMGPNPEGKVLHTVLQGGLFGPVISTYTTWDARPPGEEWHLLPRLA